MLAVLRHRQFRKLWLSQVVSQGGDWLNRMALLALIGELSGPSAAVGLGALFGGELALRLMPTAVFGPIAGPLADRIPRRLMMVTADVLRALIVLGFLFVKTEADLPLLYGLLLAQMSFGIFFDSARSASIPNTVPKEDLHAAHSLSAATWSLMLAVGSFAGGTVVKLAGLQAVFLMDSGTYVVSALLLIGLRLPRTRPERAFHWRDVLLFEDLRRAAVKVRELHIVPAVTAKMFWGGAGGYIVMLSVVGNERFASVAEAAGDLEATSVGSRGFATGLLFAARGVGTGIGPILARRFLGSTERALMRQIAGSFVVAALGYAMFGFAQELWLAFLFVTIAHMGGSTLWVAATVLWQRRVPDAWRGRVFALEFLGMTVAFALGGLATGAVYDATGSIEQTTLATSGGVLVLGALWRAFARRMAPRSDQLGANGVEGLDPS